MIRKNTLRFAFYFGKLEIGNHEKWKNQFYSHHMTRSPKGPSIYYVNIFSDFYSPNHPPNVSINTVLNVRKTGNFLDPPTQSLTDVIHGWSLSR